MTGAVILAAGQSSRFGQPKQLARFCGESLLRRTVDAANAAGCSPIIVVAGSDSEELVPELRDLDVVIVENPGWRRGIGTSIRAGLKVFIKDRRFVKRPAAIGKPPFIGGIIGDRKRLSQRASSADDCAPSSGKATRERARTPKADAKWNLASGKISHEVLSKCEASSHRFQRIARDAHKGVILMVCDQPFVDAGVIKKLIALREQTGKAIVASRYADTLGVPALFDRSCFEELLALDDADGAKPIILRDRSRVATLPFPNGEIDIDTAKDLEKLALVERDLRAR